SLHQEGCRDHHDGPEHPARRLTRGHFPSPWSVHRHGPNTAPVLSGAVFAFGGRASGPRCTGAPLHAVHWFLAEDRWLPPSGGRRIPSSTGARAGVTQSFPVRGALLFPPGRGRAPCAWRSGLFSFRRRPRRVLRDAGSFFGRYRSTDTEPVPTRCGQEVELEGVPWRGRTKRPRSPNSRRSSVSPTALC